LPHRSGCMALRLSRASSARLGQTGNSYQASPHPSTRAAPRADAGPFADRFLLSQVAAKWCAGTVAFSSRRPSTCTCPASRRGLPSRFPDAPELRPVLGNCWRWLARLASRTGHRTVLILACLPKLSKRLFRHSSRASHEASFTSFWKAGMREYDQSGVGTRLLNVCQTDSNNAGRAAQAAEKIS
jgi:hypothetical protein